MKFRKTISQDIWLFIGKNKLILGRDEKGCKMDVDKSQRVQTVDRPKKCSLVNVNQEKCRMVEVDQQKKAVVYVDKMENCRLHFSTGRRRRSTLTAAFFSVDSRQPFFITPLFNEIQQNNLTYSFPSQASSQCPKFMKFSILVNQHLFSEFCYICMAKFQRGVGFVVTFV